MSVLYKKGPGQNLSVDHGQFLNLLIFLIKLTDLTKYVSFVRF